MCLSEVLQKKFISRHFKIPLIVQFQFSDSVAAPARVLSNASRANAKSLYALWPIRAPTFRLRQSERHTPATPIRTRELPSRLSGQRRILKTSARHAYTRTPHAFTRSRLYLFNISYLSLASVPFSLWDWQRVTIIAWIFRSTEQSSKIYFV